MKIHTNAKVITSRDNLSGFGFPARAATLRDTRDTAIIHVTTIYMTSVDTLSARLNTLKKRRR